MKKVRNVMLLVCVGILLVGCAPASLVSKTSVAILVSLIAVAVAGYQFLKDRCSLRCQRKAKKLDSEVTRIVGKYHG